jgi:hypothetical protein
MSESVSLYREYVDVIRPADAPRGSINEIQLMTQTARVWWMRTKHSLSEVLADGYFDTLTDVRLLKEDTITLVASYGADWAEHAILIVEAADKHGKATVSLLHRYERQH